MNTALKLKLKPITIRSYMFSCILHKLFCFSVCTCKQVSEFHWLFKGIFLSSNWPFRLLWFWFYDIHVKRSNVDLDHNCETPGFVVGTMPFHGDNTQRKINHGKKLQLLEKLGKLQKTSSFRPHATRKKKSGRCLSDNQNRVIPGFKVG